MWCSVLLYTIIILLTVNRNDCGKGLFEMKNTEVLVIGEKKVEAIELEDGQIIEMDAVVLSMGYKPNSDLAKKSNITVDIDDFINVDEYMRTHTKDVFAIGDCAQKCDFVTISRVSTMLASTACAEARMNLFNLNVVKTFSGTIAIYSTAIDQTGFGTASVTEQRAAQ